MEEELTRSFFCIALVEGGYIMSSEQLAVSHERGFNAQRRGI